MRGHIQEKNACYLLKVERSALTLHTLVFSVSPQDKIKTLGMPEGEISNYLPFDSILP